MRKRRPRLPSPFWNRLDAVMKVQLGQTTVDQIARELGLSRMQYYRVEMAMLRAALEAVTPKKRGRKPKVVDPKIGELLRKLQSVERDKELLAIRAKELERVNSEMRRRAIGADGGKKRRRRRASKARMAVSVGVPADDARPARRP
jgi:hypothetical protein